MEDVYYSKILKVRQFLKTTSCQMSEIETRISIISGRERSHHQSKHQLSIDQFLEKIDKALECRDDYCRIELIKLIDSIGSMFKDLESKVSDLKRQVSDLESSQALVDEVERIMAESDCW